MSIRICAIAVWLALALAAADLTGVVRDPSGAAVPNAAVAATGPVAAQTVSDEGGRFRLPGLPDGAYSLIVTREGFVADRRELVLGGEAADVTIALRVKGSSEAIEVPGGASRFRNADPNYAALRGGTPRGVALVEGLTLARDVATFTFRSGTFSFLPPVLGRVAGAVFVGDGHFELRPAVPLLAEHLKRISGADRVEEDFSSAVLYFSDGTYDEIWKAAAPLDEAPRRHLGALQRARDELRHRTERPESLLQLAMNANDAPNLEAEILAELYVPAQGGSFRAMIHGNKHAGLRFVLNPRGALPMLPAPEEIALVNYDPISDRDGIWYLAHRASEIAAGRASSSEDKRTIAPEHYRIEMAIAAGLGVTATCELRFRALAGGARVVKFDLLPELRVSRVILDGREIPYVQEDRNRDGAFYIVAPEGLARDRVYRVVFEYQGHTLIEDTGDRTYAIRPRLDWYPKADRNSAATFDITFKTPRGMTGVGTGKLVRHWTEGANDAWQWTAETPLPAAGFAYGEYERKHQRDEQTAYEFETYLSRSARRGVTPQSGAATINALNAVRCFQYWFGAAPYGRLAVVEASALDSFAGTLFVPPVVLVTPGALYARTGSGRVAQLANRLDEILPAAAAGQWFGNMAFAATFHEAWLTDGFPDFAASLYDLSASPHGEAYREHWRRAREALLANTYWGMRLNDTGPAWIGLMADSLIAKRQYVIPAGTPGAGGRIIRLPPYSAPSRALTGAKGGYILQMLKSLMFDPASKDRDFIATMHDLFHTLAAQGVTTEQFKAIVERHMKPSMDLEGNGRMDWFFDEWVYGTELPSYRLEYTIEREAGKTVLAGGLTQNGVSARFRMRVPIYGVFGAKRLLIGSIAIAGNDTRRFRVPLAAVPTRVLLNADYEVLADREQTSAVKRRAD
jgi:hypothetical protein